MYGMDYSENAVKNIKEKEPTANVVCASVDEMPYPDDYFDVVMAFGLYHSIPDIQQIDAGFKETGRVMKKGGKLVFSVRLDGLENYLLERISRKRSPDGQAFLEFHKWQFDVPDVRHFTEKHGFHIREIHYARNVSFLFKYERLRARSMKAKRFNEADARSAGFKLNLLGKAVDAILHKLFPKSFSNLIVVIAEKEQ